MATSIQQYSITLTFGEDYVVGQYANGDWYIVENQSGEGVTVLSISPESVNEGGRYKNGAMVNPIAGPFAKHGFDSADLYGNYDHLLNVAANTPINIAAGSSLVCSVSNETAGLRPQLTDSAVFTIVSDAPPQGSFRPPYCGTDKTIRANTGSIDYDKIPFKEKPNSGINVPALAVIEQYMQKPWIEINTEFAGRSIHPSNNQPDYGQFMVHQMNEVILSLFLDYANSEKETALIRYLQYGIDCFGAAKSGGVWRGNGGHNMGRKLPILFAGYLLGDSEILQYANASTNFIHQEDRNTFIVTQYDVDRNVLGRSGDSTVIQYTEEMIGLAEWGVNHTENEDNDNAWWDASYRDIHGETALGQVLAANILGLRGEWSWEPAFLYAERFFEVESPNRSNGTNELKLFVADMWDAYWMTESISAPAPKSYPSSTLSALL